MCVHSPVLLDLQFALAHQTASADTEAELRSLVVGLQGDNEMNKDLVLSLQSELERSRQKVKELEEQVTKMDAMILEVQTKMQTSGLDKGSLHISKLQDIVQDAKEHILELNKLFDEDHHND